jgi:hypothetical protein
MRCKTIKIQYITADGLRSKVMVISNLQYVAVQLP